MGAGLAAQGVTRVSSTAEPGISHHSGLPLPCSRSISTLLVLLFPTCSCLTAEINQLPCLNGSSSIPAFPDQQPACSLQWTRGVSVVQIQQLHTFRKRAVWKGFLRKTHIGCNRAFSVTLDKTCSNFRQNKLICTPTALP